MEKAKTCENCGTKYIAKNTRSRFCSDSCRVSSYMKRKKQAERKPSKIMQSKLRSAWHHGTVLIAEYTGAALFLVILTAANIFGGWMWQSHKAAQEREKHLRTEFHFRKFASFAPEKAKKQYIEWRQDTLRVVEEYAAWKNMPKMSE